MLSTNRQFNYLGELTIKKSKLLADNSKPADDNTNWLFLKDKGHQYSFVYKINEPLLAEFGKPFEIKIAFTMAEEIKEIITFNCDYEVLRGPESLGKLKLIEYLK